MSASPLGAIKSNHSLRTIEMSFVKFARNTGIGISLAALTYYSYDSRAAIHKQVFMPVMRYFLDGEDAHRLSIKLLSLGIAPVDRLTDDQSLKTEVFNLPMR